MIGNSGRGQRFIDNDNPGHMALKYEVHRLKSDLG